MTDKQAEAFRTIGEVADELDLPHHVLRFWETRFSQIRPLKRGGKRRYYRPADIDLLRGIQQLLYGDGYTIKGVQRLLKEQGQRFVAEVGRGEASIAALVAVTAQEEGGQTEQRGPVIHLPDNPPETPPADILIDDSAPAPKTREWGGLFDRFLGEKDSYISIKDGGTLSKEDVQLLQSTLFELLECKRALDQAR